MAPSTESIPFFKALAALPKSYPPLVSIKLGGCDSLNTCRGPKQATAQRAAEAVAAALHRHSGITSLSVGRLWLNGEIRLQMLASGITRLTTLWTLYFDATFELTVEDMPHLKFALRSLSCLQELTFRIQEIPWLMHVVPRPVAAPPQSKQPRQTRRHEYAPRCLASALSAVTTLTHLHISGIEKVRRITAGARLRLPCLKHLVIGSCSPAAAALILTKLSAPLSTLFLHGWFRWRSLDVPEAQQLWANLPRFKHLRSVTISLARSKSSAREQQLAGAGAALGQACESSPSAAI